MKKSLILLYFIVLSLLLFIYFCPIRSTQGSSSWEIDDSGNVSYIVDGDTFDVQGVGRIRLADIDSPESGEAGYQAAKNHITSLIYDETVCLDIDDKYRTDPFGRIVAVTYIRYNSTHFLNVNKDMLDRNFAVIMNYDNEFDPSDWTLYVTKVVGAPPSADDDDDDNDDSDSSSYNYELVNGLIALGVVGGVMAVIAGSFVYPNYRKNKARKMVSPQQKYTRKISPRPKQESHTFPKISNYCIQCGIKLDPNAIFCHNCGRNIISPQEKYATQRQYNYQKSEPPKKIIKEKKLRYCDKCGNLMDFHTMYKIKVMKCVSCGKVNALRRVDLDFFSKRETKHRTISIEEKMIRDWFDQYKKMRKTNIR